MNNTATAKGGFSANDLKKIFPIIRKNWWIVIVIAAVAFFIGYFYVFKLDKVYSSRCSLLLQTNDDYNAGSVISDNTQGSKYYGSVAKTFVDNSNEIRVLESPDLIEKALSRLDFDVSYFLVGRIRTTEVYSGVPFSIKLIALNDALYEQLIKFRILSATDYEMTISLNDQPVIIRGVFNEELDNPQIGGILVTAKSNISSALGKNENQANYLVQPHRLRDLTSSFLSSLTVENPNYTNVLVLHCQDVFVDRANKFLDTLSQVYIENSLESRLELNKNTLFYIDRELEEVTNILDHIEDTLQDFREKNSVIDIDKQSDQYFDRYNGYEDKKKAIGLEQKSLDDLEHYIIEDKDPTFMPSSVYILEGDNFQVS